MGVLSNSSIDQLIEQQFKRWQLQSRPKVQEPKFRPRVIYISRQLGSQGNHIAEVLAEILGFDLFDKQLITRIAESAKMSETVVESLDEYSKNALVDWMDSLSQENHLWFDDYLEHLFKVVGTIGRHGNAVIVGRGAGYILPASFKVRLYAPLETRVDRLMMELKLSKEEAREKALQAEAGQKVFVKKYFDKNIESQETFDLLINTDCLPTDHVAQVIAKGFELWSQTCLS